jgi:hypothetical protein
LCNVITERIDSKLSRNLMKNIRLQMRIPVIVGGMVLGRDVAGRFDECDDERA